MSCCETEINNEGHDEHEIEILSSFACFELFVVEIIYFLLARSTSKFRTYEE